MLYEVIGDPASLAETLWAPQQVVTVLELLVQERRLRRRQASQIEEAILVHTDAQGHWK